MLGTLGPEHVGVPWVDGKHRVPFVPVAVRLVFEPDPPHWLPPFGHHPHYRQRIPQLEASLVHFWGGLWSGIA